MKTIFSLSPLLLCFYGLFPQSASAQWIQQLTVHPAVPVTTAPVTVVAGLAFPSGNCDIKSFNFSEVVPGRIEATSLHCLGLLTFICNDADTFNLGPLPAGSYRFILQLDAGALPAPCSPGLIATRYDSIDFTVTVPGAIAEPEDGGFSLYPNPAASSFTVSCGDQMKGGLLEIQSSAGKTIRAVPLTGSVTPIDVADLAEGLYLVTLSGSCFPVQRQKLLVSRSR